MQHLYPKLLSFMLLITATLASEPSSHAFKKALEEENIARIQKLIASHDLDVNLQDEFGYTALMVAIDQNHIPLAEQLLKRVDVDVNIQNKNIHGYTALMLAIKQKNTTLAELLLERHDIRVNLQDEDGNTALMLAIIEEEVTLVEKLLKRDDLKVNLQDEDGDTALMRASVCGNIQIGELLLKHKDMQVNQQNEEGDTALMLAVGLNHIDMVALLLTRDDLNLNLQDINAYTALIFAIEEYHVKIAELLLNRHDLDVNLQDCNKKTALAYIQGKHIDLDTPPSDNLYYVSLTKRTHLPSLGKKHALLQPGYLHALYAKQPFSHAIKQYIDILLINKIHHELKEEQKSIFYQGCLIAYEAKNSHYSIHVKDIERPKKPSCYQPLLGQELIHLLAGYLRAINMKHVSYESDWIHFIKCYLWANNQFAIQYHKATMTLQQIHSWHTNNSSYREFLDAAIHTQDRTLFQVVHQQGRYEAVATRHFSYGLKQVQIIQEEKEVFAKSLSQFMPIIVTGLKALTYKPDL